MWQSSGMNKTEKAVNIKLTSNMRPITRAQKIMSAIEDTDSYAMLRSLRDMLNLELELRDKHGVKLIENRIAEKVRAADERELIAMRDCESISH